MDDISMDDKEEPKPEVTESGECRATHHSAFGSLSFKHLLQSRKERGELVESVSEDNANDSSAKGRPQCRGITIGVGARPPIPGSSVTPALVKPVGVLLSPSNTFGRWRDSREQASIQTPSPKESSLSRSITLPYIGEVKWETIKVLMKEWLRNPKNWALLLWGVAVTVSGGILFMVMVGMLNAVLPKKSDRDVWFEVSNQIINALFTLLVLYLHPTRILHLIWLIRWRPEDILKLRAVYCKKGMRKPHEWSHMLVVVLLLHLNCFSQYALCGLNWGYKRANRPAIGVGICLVFAIGAGCAAGIYNTLSPLGKDFVAEDDEEQSSEDTSDKLEKGAQKAPPTLFHLPRKYRLLERRMTFASREGKPVENPQWEGGLFGCCETPKISIATTGCFACVLGYNLDRLGFGNRYVHICTFILLCSAPFLVFDIAAINVNNKIVRESLGGAGIVLSVFGLLYGGFWRIRMRQRYKLPAKTWCCGQPNMTDCTQWLFCSCCSLCQEVRTAEAFAVIDDKFYFKNAAGAESPGHEDTAAHIMLTPVPASLIRPLPMSDTAKIQGTELPTAGQTRLAPPPPQCVTPHGDV